MEAASARDAIRLRGRSCSKIAAATGRETANEACIGILRQRPDGRCPASSEWQKEKRIESVLEAHPSSSARRLISLHAVCHRSHDALELIKQDRADNKVGKRRDLQFEIVFQQCLTGAMLRDNPASAIDLPCAVRFIPGSNESCRRFFMPRMEVHRPATNN